MVYGVGKEMILSLLRITQSSRAGAGTELGKILDAQYAETLARIDLTYLLLQLPFPPSHFAFHF